MSTVRVANGIAWQSAGTTRNYQRNPILQPFSSTSIWNLPISLDAIFESSSGTITTQMLRTDINAWVNQESYSHPVYQASYNDPLALATDIVSGSRSGTFQIPTTALPSPGTDKHLHIIDPLGRFVHEMFGATKNSITEYSVERHHAVDLYGDGIGPFNGVRAYGGSALGGLIRSWEVDATSPYYTGRIDHAVAVALDPSQMYYSGGPVDYDHSTGYGRALGYVWPATEEDGIAPGSYTGTVPMGTYFAIPPNITISQMGLSTTSGTMLATALQNYGGYITDTTTGSFAFYIDSFAPTGFRDALRSNSAHDLNIIRANIRAVTNNSSTTPNGGSLNSQRSLPLAVDLPTPPEYSS